MLLAAYSYVWDKFVRIETAVRAVLTAFESVDSKAVLLADASNAFNSLNCQVVLPFITCEGSAHPLLFTVLINNYRTPTELFVDGDTLYSQDVPPRGILLPCPCTPLL